MPPDGWKYERIEVTRLDWLLAPASLDAIVEEIVQSSCLTEVVLDSPCWERDGKGTARIEFILWPLSNATTIAMDRLLNGAYGLRALHASDPQAGADANTAVCLAVAAAIEAERIAFDECCETHVRASLRAGIQASLSHASAKIWFDGPTDRAAGDSVSHGMVDCAVWQAGRREIDRLPERLALSRQQVEAAILKGTCVPKPLALNVEGAFLTHSGEAYTPIAKRARPMQIHMMGWS